MRIVFMGTPDFAVASLNALVEEKIIPVAVVTIPDKPKGRGLEISSSAVKKRSQELGLEILEPENLRDENFISNLKKLDIDLILVVAFKILPKEILEIPKIGCINLHASLLPKFRGAAPINWAIINGETETGVSTFFLNDKIDGGKILLQEKCEILETDNFKTLHDKLSKLGSKLLVETVNKILTLQSEGKSQNENFVTLAPKIFKNDCIINWENKSINIYNFIRGLSPYPAARTFLDKKIIQIYSSKLTALDSTKIKPAKIISEKNKLYVSTLDKFLEITELKVEGGKILSADEFLRGYKILNKSFES